VKGAYDHVVALEKKELINRAKNRSRSILLLDKGKRALRIAESAKIPILGRIAAGAMAYAEHNIEDYVSMPFEGMLDSGSKLFALRVKGDSMINADICNIAVGLGGSISGEHGIGSSKAGLLYLQYDEGALEIMRGIKATFDPKGIMNPGKWL